MMKKHYLIQVVDNSLREKKRHFLVQSLLSLRLFLKNSFFSFITRNLGYLYFLLLLFSTNVFGQKIKYSEAFAKKLASVQVDIFEPTEGKYKGQRVQENDIQPYGHAIASKQENIEIRYAILPFEAGDIRTQIPNIDFMRVVSSTATNEEREDAVISLHQIEADELKQKFNADWGSFAFFQPKTKFSDKKHCRLLGLYKENRGMIYVFFLFDEPTKFLDDRLYALRFMTKI